MHSKSLSDCEFMDMLTDFFQLQGSLTKAAKELGVSMAFLSDVLHKRRSPGVKIPAYFGLRAVTRYEPQPVQVSVTEAVREYEF